MVGGRTARTRGVLVVAEIALAVVLLTGAGLLIKSLMALHRAELGFQPDNVLVIKATGVRARADNNVFFGQLMHESPRCPACQLSARHRSRRATCPTRGPAATSSIAYRNSATAG